jgi:hypothetical protein
LKDCNAFIFTVKQSKNITLGPEDEDSTMLRSTGNYTPNNTASHPKKLESSATAVRTSLINSTDSIITFSTTKKDGGGPRLKTMPMNRPMEILPIHEMMKL